MERKICTQCYTEFAIGAEEQVFLAGLSVPLPTICPTCRQQRRLAFRNTHNLYRRNCALCKNETISLYSTDKPMIVYCIPCYWSERWDPLSFGLEFDFCKSFFEQFSAFMRTVPMPALIQLQPSTLENSSYTNETWRLKNCYLLFDGEKGDSSLYGETFFDVRECMDFSRIIDCERCYECLGCTQCYNVKLSQWSQNCTDSWFLLDCVGCSNCFGCVNLINKEYCVYNEYVGKEKYQSFISSLDLTIPEKLSAIREHVAAHVLNYPRRAVRGTFNDQVSGDNLFHSSKSFDCYDCTSVVNCRYCTELPLGAKDCQDVDVWGNSIEQCYNSAGVGENTRKIIASYYVWGSCSNIEHSMLCSHGSQNLFACIGLQKKEFCIFNKQYLENEYYSLREKIIMHMKETNEYAQFFPIGLSPFAYNESKAQDFMPLKKEEAATNGWKWYDAPLPTSSPDVRICESCARPFRLVKKEIAFYEHEKLPAPMQCFECRHKRRNALKNPRTLYVRTCAKCQKECQSSYAPDRPEGIYCEFCYRHEVH